MFTYGEMQPDMVLDIDGEGWRVTAVSPMVEVTAVDPNGHVHKLVQAPEDEAHVIL